MEGRKADAVFVDPPYNVAIDGHVSGNGSIHHREFEMASGEMTEKEFVDFLNASFGLLVRHSKLGSIHFACMDWRHAGEILAAGNIPMMLCLTSVSGPRIRAEWVFSTDHSMSSSLSSETEKLLIEIMFSSGSSAEIAQNVWQCVVIGAQVFLHNAHPPGSPEANPKSDWSDPQQETLMPPSIDKAFFEQLSSFDSASGLLHFLPLRRNESSSPIITIGYSDVALGTLNVTDYNEYKFKDPETVTAYSALGRSDSTVSLETTHGLIRLISHPTPFLFVSGITDSLLHFDEQVGTPALADAQNFAAVYNAGITVRYMLAGYLKKTSWRSCMVRCTVIALVMFSTAASCLAQAPTVPSSSPLDDLDTLFVPAYEGRMAALNATHPPYVEVIL